MSLQERVALVTGAGGEPGRELALAFGRAGYVVACSDRTPIHVEGTAAAVEADGGKALVLIGETGKGLPARALVDETLDTLGRVDVLVNALLVHPRQTLARLDEWEWQHTFEVNVSAVYLLMQAVIEPMKSQGKGVILNFIPEEPAQSETGDALWRVCLAARTALTAAACEEFLAYNISVSSISFLPEQAVRLANKYLFV